MTLMERLVKQYKAIDQKCLTQAATGHAGESYKQDCELRDTLQEAIKHVRTNR